MVYYNSTFPASVLQPLDNNRMDDYSTNPNTCSMILTTPTKDNFKIKRESATSSPNLFKFTPTKSRRINPQFGSSPSNYSNINCILSPSNNNILDENLCDQSYINKDNPQFVNEMELLQDKLFSSNIRNNVLGELGDRYEKVRQEELQKIQNYNVISNDDDMKRRNSHRYSWIHRNRFTKMDSVSNHYAAKKTRQSITPTTSKHTTPKQRKLVTRIIPDMDEEMDTQGDKRVVNPSLESATKRLKTPTGNFKEVDSPTRSHDEKLKIKEQQLNKLNHQGMPPPISTRLFASIPKHTQNRNLYPDLNKKKACVSLSRKASSQTLNKRPSVMSLSLTKLPAPTNSLRRKPSMDLSSIPPTSTNTLRKKPSMDLSVRTTNSINSLRKKPSMDLSSRPANSINSLRNKPSMDLSTGRSNHSQLRNKSSMDFSKPHIPTLSKRKSLMELSKTNPPSRTISRKSSLQTLSRKPSSISLIKKQSTLSLSEYTTTKESPTKASDTSHMPSYLLPTKASLQKSNNISKEKDKKGIRKSPTRTNIPKHMTELNSKISPSRSCVNLASYLNTESLIPPPDGNIYLNKSPGSIRAIPKSKTMSNISISPSASLRDLSSPVAPSNIPRLIKPLTLDKLSNHDDFSDDVFNRLDKPSKPWR